MAMLDQPLLDPLDPAGRTSSARWHAALPSAQAARLKDDDLSIVPYDARWPVLYDAERRRVRGALGQKAAAIEHVGSSSVPGLGGRREIDILVGVRHMGDAPACVKALNRLGYVEPPGREAYAHEWRFLTRRAPVPFELLVVRHRGRHWNHVLRFRDYLRRHPEAAERYYRLKLQASSKDRGSLTIYVDEKRRFQASVVGSTIHGTLAAIRSEEPFSQGHGQRAPAEGMAPSGGSQLSPVLGQRGQLALVGLPPLMERTRGAAEVRIGLIDGPVDTTHPDLARASVREVGPQPNTCGVPSGMACRHGTFVAGILAARRGSPAPAIAPGCTLLTRPIFKEDPGMPTAMPAELAAAILDCLEGGARVINVSAALVRTSLQDPGLSDALARARGQGAIVVAAAGNTATVGSSALTRHPSVVPVVAYDLLGRPMTDSCIGPSIGRHGLGGPGEGIVSLTPHAGYSVSAGTSVAAAFVTGAIALLWSDFPDATAQDLKTAVWAAPRSRSIVPPLMDAWAAWHSLSATRSQGRSQGRMRTQG